MPATAQSIAPFPANPQEFEEYLEAMEEIPQIIEAETRDPQPNDFK